jgi:hypothetical protein
MMNRCNHEGEVLTAVQVLGWAAKFFKVTPLKNAAAQSPKRCVFYC